MEQNEIKGPILAIDSVSRQGSVAVTLGSSALASSDSTSGNPARAEDLIEVVRYVLDSCGLKLSEMASIAVSIGPGSYSGIRIGMATAIGLSTALKIPVVGVSLLESLTVGAKPADVTTAVRAGKNDVAYQDFEVTDEGQHPVSSPLQDSETTFLSALEATHRIIVCNSELAFHLRTLVPNTSVVVDAGPNLATLIGRFASRFPERSSLKPIYLRNHTHKAVGF
ncbi:MAG TPA: tRNA (adenosine(37)-N6)-threonylcarbamoyltransferase complex dimerization subunit type 1 TsaB [Pyrinomonadaceae bacterium]